MGPAVVEFRNVNGTVQLRAVLVEKVAAVGAAVALSLRIDRHTARIVLEGISVPAAAAGELDGGAGPSGAPALPPPGYSPPPPRLRVGNKCLGLVVLHPPPPPPHHPHFFSPPPIF